LALSSPSRSPTYPFSAQRLAAIASRLPQGAERQQLRVRTGLFTTIFAEVMAILWLKKDGKHAYGRQI
ncbi:MAG: hypothetical protein PHT80_06485, partial [Lentisphaeria bacterium]|nr:hypothetical protein [Lentisphaeria bacterium]